MSNSEVYLLFSLFLAATDLRDIGLEVAVAFTLASVSVLLGFAVVVVDAGFAAS